jgi:hypothetical protein
MAWDPAFLAALNQGRRLRFEVESFHPGVGVAPGTPYVLSGDHLMALSSTARSLQPGSWRAELGAFSFTTAPSVPGDVVDAFVRGCPIAVYAIVDGVRYRVEIGRVYEVRRGLTRGSLVFNCLDLFSSLSSRWALTTVSTLALFYDVEVAGALTELVGSWDPGGGTPTVLTVLDASGFDKDSDTGKNGIMRVSPADSDPSPFEPFLLLWSAVAGDVFTVNPTAVHGTTAVLAPDGSIVKHVAYLSDSVFDTVRKVITSTGGGGAYDTLPQEWGYSLEDDLIDHGDTGQQKSIPGATASTWQIRAESQVDNGYDYLNTLLSAAGFFVGVRQGQITVRTVHNPASSPFPSGYTITDDDLAEAPLQELYDSQSSVTYGGVRMTGPTTIREHVADGQTIDALPGQEWDDRSMPWSWADEVTVLDEAALRLLPLNTRTPERITLRCLSLKLAGLTLGDSVPLSSRYLLGRPGGAVYSERPCMVVGMAVNWTGRTVSLELLSWPTG